MDATAEPARFGGGLGALLQQCAAYDRLASSVAVVDADGELRYANQAFRRFNDAVRDAPENLRRQASLLTCPTIRAWLQAALAAARPEPWRGTLYFSPRIRVDLALCLAHVTAPDGGVEGGLLTLGEESIEFDKHHLARAQETRRELAERIKVLDREKTDSQRLVGELLHNAPVAMALLNQRREVVHINHAGARLFEVSAAAVRGRLCDSVLPCSGQCGPCPALTDACDPTIEEVAVTSAGGHRLTLLRSVALLKGRGGEPLILGAFVDITERKAAEVEYRSILQTALDGFWLADGKGRLLEVNDAYCAMSGYGRDELLAMRIPDLEAEESPEETRRHIEKIMATGSDRFETRHRRKDGTIIDVEISTQFLTVRGGIFVVFVKDITERKAQDTALRRARDAAEAANRAKSRFLSNMSHELRTPLNAIIGFSQLLGEEKLVTEVMDSVSHIHKAGKHLLTLVNEILDLSRIEAGRLGLAMGAVDLDDLVQNSLALIAPLAARRGIVLNRAAGDAALVVEADCDRLGQALLNLISNAIKFNRPQGSVAVKTERRADGRIRISVADTGIGIKPEDLPNLFTPFSRFGPTHVEGTGIGLTITRNLVQMMGGTLGVESEAGAGSTFWIELEEASRNETVTQCTAAPVGMPAVPATILPPHTEAVILYFEDNLDNLYLVRRILEHHCPQMELLTASDPREGLSLARSRPIDLILLDINMPGVSGFEVLHELRANAATRGIPVVAVSANAMPEDIAVARAAGVDDYVTKPFSIGQILAAIARQLRQSAKRW